MHQNRRSRVAGSDEREVVVVLVMVYTGIEVMGFRFVCQKRKKEKPEPTNCFKAQPLHIHVICDAHIYYEHASTQVEVLFIYI